MYLSILSLIIFGARMNYESRPVQETFGAGVLCLVLVFLIRGNRLAERERERDRDRDRELFMRVLLSACVLTPYPGYMPLYESDRKMKKMFENLKHLVQLYFLH